MSFKPQLAEDAVLDKVIFPCLVQPKIDGVRAMNLEGTLTGRSLDPLGAQDQADQEAQQESEETRMDHTGPMVQTLC